MSIKPIDCPLSWTGEQAPTVVDYLYRLREAIREACAEQIIELRTAELSDEPDTQPDEDQYCFEFSRSPSGDGQLPRRQGCRRASGIHLRPIAAVLRR